MPVKVTSHDRLAKSVMKMYERAEMRLMRNFSRRFAMMAAGKMSQAAMLAAGSSVSAEAGDVLQELRAARIRATEQAIRNAYDESVKNALGEILQTEDLAEMPLDDEILTNSGGIQDDLTKRLDLSDSLLKRQYLKTYEDVVADVAEAVADGEEISRAVGRFLRKIADSGFTGFVDTSGRRWNHVNYAEMAAVSALETAVIKGFMNTLELNNYDLVLIEGHYGGCPICTAWNGVVISITGSTEGYPTFEDAVSAGCFHPMCSHHLALYREGMGDEVRFKPWPVKKPTTGYSMAQQQRHLEAEIRRWKRRAAVSIDPAGEKTAYAYIRYYQGKIRSLLKENNGLERMRWREGVGKEG